jgi:hypothetical protein
MGFWFLMSDWEKLIGGVVLMVVVVSFSLTLMTWTSLAMATR